MSSKAQCSYIKPAGERCKATCLPASSYCWFHDPSREQERAEGRKKGGQARSKPMAVLPMTALDEQVKDVPGVIQLLGQSSRAHLETLPLSGAPSLFELYRDAAPVCAAKSIDPEERDWFRSLPVDERIRVLRSAANDGVGAAFARHKATTR